MIVDLLLILVYLILVISYHGAITLFGMLIMKWSS
jgi:hypothetical protein